MSICAYRALRCCFDDDNECLGTIRLAYGELGLRFIEGVNRLCRIDGMGQDVYG